MAPTDSTTPKPLRHITASEFARRLNIDLSTQDKRYAFFLGSGCSVTSGIKTAGQLVTDEWLPKLRDIMAPEESDHEAWGSKRFSYDSKAPAASYGVMMKELFLQSEEQQREIERLCDNKFPAFGYSVLAELMQHTKSNGTFNVVLTTNFDDLVADALYLFTSIRPLIIHHESLAGYIRPTRTRPLIIKLHGDNHLSPYNTPEQTAALPEKTNQQVRNLLHDRGLIFLGYSGNDESIMHLLNKLPEDALPLGIYWCSETEPSCQLSDWLRKCSAIWVESPRFDEFMLLLHAAMDLGHPERKRFDEVFDKRMETYQTLTGAIEQEPANSDVQTALKAAVAKTDKSFPDWRSVALEASRLQNSNPAEAEAIYKNGLERLPNSAELLGSYASFLKREKRAEEAEKYYRLSLTISPNNVATLANYGAFLKQEKRVDEAEEYYKRGFEEAPTNINILNNYANLLLEIKRFEEAEHYYRLAIDAEPSYSVTLSNYAIFLVGRNRLVEAEEFFKRALEADSTYSNALIHYAGMLDKQHRIQEAEEYYKRGIASTPSPNANSLANHARLLLATGSKNALSLLDQANATVTIDSPADLLIELAFYELAHRPPLGSVAQLAKLKSLLIDGQRSKGWDLSRNVRKAQQDNHPFAEWLPKLAAVIADEAPLETLADWPEWQQAEA